MSQEKWAWTEASSLCFQYHNTTPKRAPRKATVSWKKKNRTRGLSTPKESWALMCCCLLSPPPQPSSALLLRHFWCLVFEGWDTNCLLPQDQVANPIAYPRRCCQSQYPVTARWEECCCRQYTQASGWLLWYRVFRTTSFRSLECNCPNETVQESSLSSLPAMCAVLSNFNKLSEIQVSHLKKKGKNI